MSSETSHAQVQPARLLVVDDEESIVLTISEVLRREGYEVDVAMSGAETVWKLRREEFDLILTDLHMEEGDGLSVLAEARRHAPLTITIVLTGYANVETAISALRHGAYDYLLKPCNIEEMKLTVRRGLDHRRLMLAEREARANLEKLNRELERRVAKRTRELVRVNEELSEANRAKDVFLATLSHELRTPLTPVLGWVNLLRTGGGPAADPKMLAQGLDAIERNARLQARLIDDLLDISRIVSGKLRIEWEPVDLCGVVEATVEALRPEAEARRVRLSVERPVGALVVQGAPLRLQQIVWNLLANAVKFTPDGGSVRSRVWREGGEARVEVTDTGIGITSDFLPHVFDRFRQADGTTTRAYGGLGLGLAIVRALTELHGGWVVAASEGEGRGSTFTFGVPSAAAPAGEVKANEQAQAAEARAGLPVLVVEDSSETLELLQILFARKGYDVIGAGSAAEALDRVGQRRPGLIISDISMPDVDGYTLLEQLRRLPGLEGVPAIALTGHAMDEDRERALAAGFSVHLPKPVDPDELFRIVRLLTG